MVPKIPAATAIATEIFEMINEASRRLENDLMVEQLPNNELDPHPINELDIGNGIVGSDDTREDEAALNEGLMGSVLIILIHRPCAVRKGLSWSTACTRHTRNW